MRSEKFKLGIVLLRRNFIRHLSRLLDFVHARGHEVVLLIPAQPTKKTPGEFLTPEYINGLFQGRHRCSVFTAEDIETIVAQQDIQALVFLEGPRFIGTAHLQGAVQRLRSRGILMTTISMTWDTCLTPFHAFDDFDLVCLYNEYEKQVLRRSLQLQRSHEGLSYTDHDIDLLIEQKCVATGMPLYDTFSLINRDTVRADLGIPRDTRAVLLMVPYFGFTEGWRQQVIMPRSFAYRLVRSITQGYFKWRYLPDMLAGMGFASFVREVKSFAARNNAVLLTKRRTKNRGAEIPVVEQYGDFNFSDDEPYPADTTSKLIMAADLVITTRSTVMHEVVFAGVPVIHVTHPNERYDQSKETLYTDFVISQTRSLEQESAFNFPGCIRCLPYREIKKFFRQGSIDEVRVDPARRSEYLSRFGQPEHTSASAAIYSAIQSRLSAKNQ